MGRRQNRQRGVVVGNVLQMVLHTVPVGVARHTVLAEGEHRTDPVEERTDLAGEHHTGLEGRRTAEAEVGELHTGPVARRMSFAGARRTALEAAVDPNLAEEAGGLVRGIVGFALEVVRSLGVEVARSLGVEVARMLGVGVARILVAEVLDDINMRSTSARQQGPCSGSRLHDTVREDERLTAVIGRLVATLIVVCHWLGVFFSWW